MSRWEPDVLPGYWQCTFALGPDPDGEGELEATLVRRGDADPSARHAVLMLSLIHISEPTRLIIRSRMPSSA